MIKIKNQCVPVASLNKTNFNFLVCVNHICLSSVLPIWIFKLVSLMIILASGLEMFYLTIQSKDFIYGYMVSDIW